MRDGRPETPGTATGAGRIKPRSRRAGQGDKTGRFAGPIASRIVNDDPKPWRVLSSRYLHREPPWLVLREDRVELPTGVQIERYWVNEYEPWCNVVAVTPDDRIVLIRQYRHGIGAVHYELPGGVADHGTPEESARTELLQETGYGGGVWKPLMTLSANPSLTNNLTHTFLAVGVERIADTAHEPTEDLRIHLIPSDELAALIDAGDVIQALHAAPLLRYLLTR